MGGAAGAGDPSSGTLGEKQPRSGGPGPARGPAGRHGAARRGQRGRERLPGSPLASRRRHPPAVRFMRDSNLPPSRRHSAPRVFADRQRSRDGLLRNSPTLVGCGGKKRAHLHLRVSWSPVRASHLLQPLGRLPFFPFPSLLTADTKIRRITC